MSSPKTLYSENLGLLPWPMCALQDWMPPIPTPPQPIFCFNLQQPSQNTLPFHLQQNAHNLASTSSPSSSSLSMCDNFLSMTLSQALDAQLENERLKSILREQRKRQLGTLLKTMEWKALYLMKRKEEDLARATKKTMKLEACLKKAEMESEWWERFAKANEAMVMDLSNTMEQVKKELIRVSNNHTAKDTKSRCCSSCDQRDDQQEEKKSKKVACKHCRSRSSCVPFLPCRQITHWRFRWMLLGPMVKKVEVVMMRVGALDGDVV
ncbi:putative BOI-related E3 ubiquitin-protein ligase 2 [Gossypium australe]|uniref:Putative BOI-related E3 ubiquitin-protein ligase 2 n=1 Tax=Gossypium australe TaxID=47621 RepID=A0A5B6UMI0_9ROSI|nr:putative BOI-related E3 ubiquitin-protein ligase 2 [Gossypium australe]